MQNMGGGGIYAHTLSLSLYLFLSWKANFNYNHKSIIYNMAYNMDYQKSHSV